MSVDTGDATEQPERAAVPAGQFDGSDADVTIGFAGGTRHCNGEPLFTDLPSINLQDFAFIARAGAYGTGEPPVAFPELNCNNSRLKKSGRKHWSRHDNAFMTIDNALSFLVTATKLSVLNMAAVLVLR